MEHAGRIRARICAATASAMIVAAVALVSVAAPARADTDLFDLPIESLMRVQVSVASPFGESVMDSAS